MDGECRFNLRQSECGFWVISKSVLQDGTRVTKDLVSCEVRAEAERLMNVLVGGKNEPPTRQIVSDAISEIDSPSSPSDEFLAALAREANRNRN